MMHDDIPALGQEQYPTDTLLPGVASALQEAVICPISSCSVCLVCSVVQHQHPPPLYAKLHAAGKAAHESCAQCT